MVEGLKYVHVVLAGEWSGKYGRFVYPAFQDRDTHNDFVAGIENRWHAEKYMRFEDVQKLRAEWNARIAVAETALASMRAIAAAPETLEALSEIANIAHHGGLIGFGTSAKAMDAIRELSRRWWDRKECERLQATRTSKSPNP